jgi:uncharacterized protein (DUF697 family)
MLRSEEARMSWMDSLKAAAKGAKSVGPDERARIASDIVMMASMGAAAVTYAPVPLTDFVLVTPVQASMVMAIGRVSGRELDFDESKHIVVELASVCGLSLIAQKGFATLSKIFLPGLGGILAGPYAFGVTYAMGRVAIGYFEDREHSRETLRRIFEDALREGKSLFSLEKLNAFRKKWGKDVDEFARGAAGQSRARKGRGAHGKKRARGAPPPQE